MFSAIQPMIFRHFIFFILYSCSTAIVPLAVKNNKLKLETINPHLGKQFSQEELEAIEAPIHLDKIMKSLLAIADENEGMKNLCGLSPQEASEKLLQLHQLKEEKLLQFNQIKAAKKKDLIQLFFPQWSCEAQCHCGLLSQLLDSNDPMKEKIHDRDLAQDEQDRTTCALETRAWICQDEYLKK